MVELGLLLYKICAGENIDYGNRDNGLRRAKLRALKELSKVAYAVGTTLAEIIQDLLFPNTLVPPDGETAYKDETEYILDAITPLTSYEHHVEDTVTGTEHAHIQFPGKAPSFQEPPPNMYRVLDGHGVHVGVGAGEVGHESQSEQN